MQTIWALLCRDGHGNYKLWNEQMYARHVHGGEILASVKLIMHHGSLMIVEESPTTGKILHQTATAEQALLAT